QDAASEVQGTSPATAEERREAGHEGDGERAERPVQRRARQPGETRDEEQKQERARQAPAEVVQDLPPVDGSERALDALAVCRGHPGEQPRKELPVAAHPPVHTPRVRGILRWVLFEENDIARERGSPVDSPEEVVAGEGVLRNAALDAAHERIDV